MLQEHPFRLSQPINTSSHGTELSGGHYNILYSCILLACDVLVFQDVHDYKLEIGASCAMIE